MSASYDPAGRTLAVFGDAAANELTVSRDATGKLLVNGGAVPISGGAPTAAGTSLVEVFASGGNDVVALDERGGVLPAAHLYGSFGDDRLTGGSRADELFGQQGNDALLGRVGRDALTGGDGADTVTGGNDEDVAQLGTGDDRFVWNPGNGKDDIDDSGGNDTFQLNGGAGADEIGVVAGDAGVRLLLEPSPVALDVDPALEAVAVDAKGGDDTINTFGNLAAVTRLTLAGGPGADKVNGGNGDDTLSGGDGADVVDGNAGTDVAMLGAGDDRFAWSPGDGSDTIEGQLGSDELEFDGSGAAERIEVSADGQRARLTRDVANIALGFAGIERLAPALAEGTDTLTLGDLGGTAITEVDADLAAIEGTTTPDGAQDRVVVRGTVNADAIDAVASTGQVAVTGLRTAVRLHRAEAGDALIVESRGGDDTVDASTLPATAASLTIDAADGDDSVLGGHGADVVLGGAGDDDIDGGPGSDVALLGGDDDRFAWGPGDGSDTVEGQTGSDRLSFTGSGAAETVTLSANGNRVRLHRDVAFVVMDLNDIEQADVAVVGGPDTVAVEDLTGTDLAAVNPQLGLQPFGRTGDRQVDRVVVNGTNAPDHFTVAGSSGAATVMGLQAATSIIGAELHDRLEVRGLGGDDTIDASGLRPTMVLSFVQ